jgi:multicomponent Na+:H+ antiporter subunit B
MVSFSVILATGARYMVPIILLFSIFILFRGHYEPGGGFIGGLAAATAFVLFAIAHGVERSQRLLAVEPRVLIGSGLLLSLCSGLLAFLIGTPFLTGLWLPFEVPPIGSLGTPLLFDVGVYLVVIGIVLQIVFVLAESEE